MAHIEFCGVASSYELKNFAVSRVSGEWVAIVDADCIPNRGWLRALRARIAKDPQAAVISAKTMYPGRTLLERLLGLITRAYIDPGPSPTSSFAYGNATCYRRDVYLQHPLPTGIGAFANRIQSEAIRRAGGELHFEPKMSVVHDFEGWNMELDIRRNHGFSTVATRLADPRIPFAGLVRLGAVAIPAIVAGKICDSFDDCLRCYSNYNVRFWELPLAFGLVIVTHAFEVPGMWAAYNNRMNSGSSAYR